MPNPQNPANPRDPQGGEPATLNPTRDHVQGEPEGTTPLANDPGAAAQNEATAPPSTKKDPTKP